MHSVGHNLHCFCATAHASPACVVSLWRPSGPHHPLGHRRRTARVPVAGVPARACLRWRLPSFPARRLRHVGPAGRNAAPGVEPPLGADGIAFRAFRALLSFQPCCPPTAGRRAGGYAGGRADRQGWLLRPRKIKFHFFSRAHSIAKRRGAVWYMVESPLNGTVPCHATFGRREPYCSALPHKFLESRCDAGLAGDIPSPPARNACHDTCIPAPCLRLS